MDDISGKPDMVYANHAEQRRIGYMEIGCCVSAGNIEKLPGCGFDFVELPGRELFQMEPGPIAALRRRLDERGLRCRSLNAYCPDHIIMTGPGQNLDEARAYARKLAAYASELSVDQVGIGAPGSRRLPEGFLLCISHAL